jgi:glutamate racemase
MTQKMKIGVFDSGLGGLAIARSIRDALPEHDIIYLGDTLHVPYGSRSAEVIAQYTEQSMKWLLDHDCQLIIVACNTATAMALRHIQQNLVANEYPDRRILGVIVPTLEFASQNGFKRIGLLATERIVKSDIYRTELHKIDPEIQLSQHAAPLLVSAIEMGSSEWFEPLIEAYLKPILANNVECLILGCTHYVLVRDIIDRYIDKDVYVISQDDLIPSSVIDYLIRHPEIDEQIGRNGTDEFFVTDVTESYIKNAEMVYNRPITIQKAYI